jgi:glutaredoxin 3
MPDETNGRVTLYSTEPCGHCRNAKALLADHGVDYEEVNLGKNPEGRAKLVQRTGLMTFPQLIVGDEVVGGLREMLQLEREGRLEKVLSS